MCSVELMLCGCCETTVGFYSARLKPCKDAFWGRCIGKIVRWCGPFVCRPCHYLHRNNTSARCPLVSEAQRQRLRARPYLEMLYHNRGASSSMLLGFNPPEHPQIVRF